MKFLSENYPSLYICILDFFDKSDEIERYMSQVEEIRKNQGIQNKSNYSLFRKEEGSLTYENYSLYIHCYWLVWLGQQRKAGKL